MISHKILPTFGRYMKLRESNILVVDDDPDVLTAVRLLLKPLVKSIEFSRYPDEIKSLLKQTYLYLYMDTKYRYILTTVQ